MQPKITLEQFERKCPANESIRRDNGGQPTRRTIRDWRVLIDGEHRATLVKQSYGSRGYTIHDPDHRKIVDPDDRAKQAVHYWRAGQIASQAGFHQTLRRYLEGGSIPTLAEIELDRQRDNADAENNRIDQLAANIKRAKELASEQLFNAVAAQQARLHDRPNPFGHDCRWCSTCYAKVDRMLAEALEAATYVPSTEGDDHA